MTFLWPSRKGLISAGLIASVASVFFFPFIFRAFGPGDNPFDAPVELLWIALLALAIFACLLMIDLARRGLTMLWRNRTHRERLDRTHSA